MLLVNAVASAAPKLLTAFADLASRVLGGILDPVHQATWDITSSCSKGSTSGGPPTINRFCMSRPTTKFSEMDAGSLRAAVSSSWRSAPRLSLSSRTLLLSAISSRHALLREK